LNSKLSHSYKDPKYLVRGLTSNTFGESEIKGWGLTVSNYYGVKGASDSTAMTSQCSQNYHLLGGAFLAGYSAVITGTYSGL